MNGIKRVLALLLALAVVFPLMPQGRAMADEYVFGQTYKSATVNLRSRPSAESTRLGTYDKGTWMEILDSEDNWFYVRTPDGKQGYMSKNYVTIPNYSISAMGTVVNPKETSFLNLRAEPSYSAKVLGIYYNGVPCVVLSQSGSWCHVRVNGVEGYFNSPYIRISSGPYGEQAATVVTPGLTSINMRSGPGKQYSVVRRYKGGTYVTVLCRGNGWWMVSVDGMVGFMDVSFLEPGILSPSEVARAAGKGNNSSNGSEIIPLSGYAIVTNPKATQVLNLRESASTTARSVGQFRNGARLTVLGQGTEWCRVLSENGLTGYMMTKYLTLVNLPAVPTLTVTHPQGSYVNLRAIPSTYGAILCRVPSSQTVTVVAPGDGWVRVKYRGMVGYMSAPFLK